MILLGWEIGTGKRVEIPDTGHLAWFGQTQLSGKTTALEAIAFRGGLRAVAFITKQGEGGFLTGRMIPPYFSEPTNDEEQPLWRWVKSILEASQQRKLSFEEAWIIRACEEPNRAETLADVHENIKALLAGEYAMDTKGKGKRQKQVRRTIRKPVSGINSGVYTSLKAYFDIVMPQLARLPYTKKLELFPGLNVMNLSGYAMETQALVIRSVMEWVYQHEKNVRVIVPEAQDFVPQGKNSPVKMACETLVRKAGANKNFMWLDSQDMAAVDKFALRACSIVGIGVQTEMHEIDRALATTFSPSLKPVDIARLKIGEFFVRTSEARVSKVYVQPAWMASEIHAQAIAKGEETAAGARAMLNDFKKKLSSKSENAEPSSPEPQSAPKPKRGAGAPQMLQIQLPPGEDGYEGDDDETFNEASTANQSEPGNTGSANGVFQDGPPAPPVRGASLRGDEPRKPPANAESETPESEEVMEKSSALVYIEESLVRKPQSPSDNFFAALDDLVNEHHALIRAHDALAERVRTFEGYTGRPPKYDLTEKGRSIIEHGVAIPRNGHLSQTQEDLYKYVIKRASEDPGVLQVLTRKPELRIKLERPIVQMDDATIIGRIAKLIHENYFSAPKTVAAVQKELKRRGCDQPTTNIYKPMNKLTGMGFLTLESDGFQSVPEMKVQIEKA